MAGSAKPESLRCHAMPLSKPAAELTSTGWALIRQAEVSLPPPEPEVGDMAAMAAGALTLSETPSIQSSRRLAAAALAETAADPPSPLWAEKEVELRIR